MLSYPTVNPAELVPNPWNSNVVSKDHEAKLDASLSRLQMFKPVVVREIEPDADGRRLQILGGKHRWESAKRLGLATIPVYSLGKIGDIQAKEISLADNARYGTDDSLALSELLKGLDVGELQDFLPYSETDISSIFASETIDLDDLELDEDFETTAEAPEEKVAKAPKTHTVMRFKVALADAERISELLGKIKKNHGYTGADELTNAGDALVHVLFALSADPA